MNTTATPSARIVRYMEPGIGVSGFHETRRDYPETCLATDVSILFDAVYAANIDKPEWFRQRENIQRQVLSQPELIDEILDIIHFHRTSAKQHNPGLDAIKYLQGYLKLFAREYPDRMRHIVDRLVSIFQQMTNEIYRASFLRDVCRFICEFSYCPDSFVELLLAAPDMRWEYCPDDINRDSLRAAVHHPAGEAALVQKMNLNPESNWSWVLIELYDKYPDFQERFIQLRHVALAQATYFRHGGYQSYVRAASASLFGPGIREALFLHWEQAGELTDQYEKGYRRAGAEFALAGMGNLGELIDEFNTSPTRTVAIIKVICDALQIPLYNHEGCRVLTRLQHIHSLSEEFKWIIQVAKSSNLMIQRHALRALSVSVQKLRLGDGERRDLMGMITSLPPTNIPIDRELRLELALQLPRDEQGAKLRGTPSKDEPLLKIVKRAIEVIRVTHSLRNKWLTLVKPELLQPQPIEPSVSLIHDVRYRVLLSEEELQTLQKLANGGECWSNGLVRYVYDLYQQTLREDTEISQHMLHLSE